MSEDEDLAHLEHVDRHRQRAQRGAVGGDAGAGGAEEEALALLEAERRSQQGIEARIEAGHHRQPHGLGRRQRLGGAAIGPGAVALRKLVGKQAG